MQSVSFIHTGLQLYNTLPSYFKEIPSSKFKSQLQALLHKNRFYGVNQFKVYFQNKDEAKPKTKNMFACINSLISSWF